MFKIKEKGKSKENRFSISLTTPYEYDQRNPHNVLNFSIFGYYIYLHIPEIIKPKAVSKTRLAEGGVPAQWIDHIQRAYSVSLFEDTWHFRYGIQPGCWIANDKGNSDQSFCWTIPWRNYYRVKNEVFLPENSAISYPYTEPKFSLEDYVEGRAYEFFKQIVKSHRKHTFIFNDYDGEEITAKVYMSRGTFGVNGGKSTGFWGFLTKVCKEKVYYYIECEFDKEVGERKGSWKGGTTSTHAPMQDKETLEEAFTRIMTDGGRDGKCTNIRHLGVM